MTEAARILVVDDNLQNRLVAEGYLEQAGYRTLLAASGAEALELFREGVDLVLLDILMPGLDGYETCRRLRALEGGDHVPIVFLTALADLHAHEQALTAGADDFLSKPIHRTELLLRVRSLLRLRSLHAELVETARTVREQHDALLRAEAQRKSLIGMIVHDLKGPLTAITGNAQYLLMLDSVRGEAREVAGDIEAAGTSMHDLVLDMLDVSRSDDGALQPRRARVDVLALLTAARALVAGRAAASSVAVEVSVDEGARSVQADPDLLRRIVANLLDNAIRYAPARSRVVVRARADLHTLELDVADEGPGIPPELRDSIFDRYVQVEARYEPGRVGHGLGLAFCRLAVQAQGGEIEVLDNSPRGALFRIRIPESVIVPRSELADSD
jgi:signal transduction histidine kinase